MKIKRLISAILCAVMLTLTLPLGSFYHAASNIGAGACEFKIIANGSTFNITRSSKTGFLPRQTVILRTVSLSAVEGVHFTPIYQRLVFNEGEDTSCITVNEISSEEIENIVDRYQSGTTRAYRFEVLDADGFLLASCIREISYDPSYKFNNEWIMEHNGDHLLYIDNGVEFYSQYISTYHLKDLYLDVSFPGTSSYKTIHDVDGNGYSQGVWTASTDELFNRSGCAPREYLAAIGDKMYASVGFKGLEIDEGYQYIQILTDNSTSYDDKDGDGTVNNPSVSIYKACFELNTFLKQYRDEECLAMFPTQFNTFSQYENENQNSTFYYELSRFEKIYNQKFRSNSLLAENSGSFVLEPSVESLSVRFNARGKDRDDWKFKDLFARLALVDRKDPSVTAVGVSAGPNAKHNQATITIMFSEIVKPVGEVTLRTSWGNFKPDYIPASSYANSISFTGEITSNENTVLKINGFEGTIKDLQGNTLSNSFSRTLSQFTVGTTKVPSSLNGVFQMSCQSDLYWFSDYLKIYPQTSAALTSDLNMYASLKNPLNPMCENGFSGIFDGCGFSLINLYVKQKNSSATGLFAIIYPKGSVLNLTLERSSSVSATSPSCIGGIAAINLGRIEKCRVECSVSANGLSQNGSGNSFGGITGINSGTVKDCLVGLFPAEVCISNSWDNMIVGGVIGKNEGNLISSMFYANYNSLSTTNITRGAVCGTNTGTIANSFGVHFNSNYFVGAVGSNTGTMDNVTFSESNDFFTGKVCFNLNGGVTDGTQSWYQNLDDGELPAFKGSTVYKHGSVYTNNSAHVWTQSYRWDWDGKINRYIVSGTARCNICGEEFCAQSFASETAYVSPTCVEAGYSEYTVLFDDYAEYGFDTQVRQDIIAALGHSKYSYTTQHLCTSPGEKVTYCHRCDYVEMSIVPASDHTFGIPVYDWRIKDDSYSIVATVKCTDCIYSISEEGMIEIDTEGNPCEDNFTHILRATFSDVHFSTQTNTVERPKMGHDWGEINYTLFWNSEEEANYASATRSCNRCGKTEEEQKKAALLKIEPTCTESGYYYYSADFDNKVFSIDDFYHLEINPIGHDFIPVEKQSPTCDKEGWCAHYKCTRCSKRFLEIEGEYEETPLEDILYYPFGHNLIESIPAQATCTTYGYNHCYFCSNCNRYFSDKDGTIEISYSESYIEPLGHKLTHHNEVSETCTEPGIRAYEECTVCGKKFDTITLTEITDEDYLILPPRHSLGPLNYHEPSCHNFGNIYCYRCSNCSKYFEDSNGVTELTLEEIQIPPIEHNLVCVFAKEPTCTEDGCILHWECTNCHRCFVEGSDEEYLTSSCFTIPSLGHNLVYVDTKEASCTEGGYSAHYICSRCNCVPETIPLNTISVSVSDILNDIISAIINRAAIYDGIVRFDSSDGESGSEVQFFSEQYLFNIVSAIDYYAANETDVESDFFSYVIYLNQLETAYRYMVDVVEGESTLPEPLSSYILGQSIQYYGDTTPNAVVYYSALGHSVEAWHSDNVSHWHICSTCGESVDNCNHTISEWITDLDPTATSVGRKHKECTVCKAIIESEEIPKTHLPGDVNGDGTVNNKDLTRLLRYLSDWNVEVNEAALDINGDGYVNNKDFTRLFRYLSDWNVEIY